MRMENLLDELMSPIMEEMIILKPHFHPAKNSNSVDRGEKNFGYY